MLDTNSNDFEITIDITVFLSSVFCLMNGYTCTCILCIYYYALLIEKNNC